MAKQYINENQLKNIIAEQVKGYLAEEFFGNDSFEFEAKKAKKEKYGKNDDVYKRDERLSDMSNENDEDSELRDSIESFFKQPGVNCAAYAYKLYGVKASEGEDTDEMKNARSKFAKCLNHEKNEAGYPYSFTSAELNTLKGMISSNQLNERINKAINESFKKMKHSINEGQYDNSPITKWVYWCFNFPFPQEWIPQIEWNGAGADHFMNKFKEAYQSAGSKGVMNRFFVELDKVNQQKLIDYVMNNY